MIGQTISHYKILEKIGEGGMGLVYRAHDTRLDRVVALKFLPSKVMSSEIDKQRFAREAKAAAALNHANICVIHSVDEIEEQRFITMEYIDGVTLREKIRNSSSVSEGISAGHALNYAIQIVKGIHAAHKKGIIHRDLKSNNIMVTHENEIKILDFGLARIGGADRVTKTGRTVGTLSYMSPEQVRGEHIDERSDIWAVGIILYEMITGNLPFVGEYEHAVMYSILNKDPQPVTDEYPALDPGFSEIISRCIAKAPSDRFQSAAELLDEIINLNEKLKVKVNKAGPAAGKSKSPNSLRRPYARFGIVTGLILLFSLILLNVGIIQEWFVASSEYESIRLMVLPFTNIGDDPGRQVFCDGLVETITSNLSRLEQFHESLWVVPAGEVRSHGIRSPGEAHKTFGVNYAVTGSLQPILDRLRLTIHLVDSKNLRQLNSEVIDVDANDVLALHEKSVENLLTMLNLELNPESREIMREGNTSVSAAFELYIQGIGYLQRYETAENVEAAIGSFKESVELDPGFALAYAGLGQAYWRKYDFTREFTWLEKAKDNSRTAQRLNDKLAQVNITLGMINTGTGQYEDAIKNFNDVLAVDPTNADAYRELARSYESLGDIGKAESTIKRAIRLNPENWAGYNYLGAFYSRHNRYDEAIEQFKKVIELTPDNHRGYMNLGTMYYYQERLDDARIMFERSLELEKSYDALSNLGTLYFNEGRYQDAVRMFETALELHDGHYLIWGNIASAYYWTADKREKAFPAYEEAVKRAEKQKEINPNDPVVIIDLAGYQAMLGREDEARRYIQEAIEMAPDNTLIMYLAGAAYERLDERERALQWIMKAIEHGYSKSEIINQPELQDLISDERFQQRFDEP